MSRDVRDLKPTEIKRTLENKLGALGQVSMPSEAEEPILDGPIRAGVHAWLNEIWAADKLQDVGLEPRRTALLFGPPGCGKTTLAHHFSARLGLPMVTVVMDQMIGGTLGSSQRNVGAVFSAMQDMDGKCILFLDEFDSIATKRTTDNQAAAREMNAMVTALLTRIEAFKGIAFAATNRGDEIDPALWRRFGIHMDIGVPTFDARFAILKRYLHPYEFSDDTFDLLSEVTEGAPPSLLRQLMEGLKRNLVLHDAANSTPADQFNVVLATLAPHSSYQAPPLWTEGGQLVSDIEWPPERATQPNEDAA